MESFRLIIDPPMNAADNMAKDQAIAEFMGGGDSLPALRLYRWSRPSVTVGYFQDMRETVNAGYCAENGIDVIRRNTGGGTVLHNMELTYSFTIPVANSILPHTVEGAFKSILSPVINALRALSINAEYKPVNDIVVNMKKISGSAQVRKRGILQQHGTILLSVDRELMSSALTPDMEKYIERGFDDPMDALTSVKDELGVTIDEKFTCRMIDLLAGEYSSDMNINFLHTEISEPEACMMKSLSQELSSRQWNCPVKRI